VTVTRDLAQLDELLGEEWASGGVMPDLGRHDGDRDERGEGKPAPIRGRLGLLSMAAKDVTPASPGLPETSQDRLMVILPIRTQHAAARA
jgi:hypothetical protein